MLQESAHAQRMDLALRIESLRGDIARDARLCLPFRLRVAAAALARAGRSSSRDTGDFMEALDAFRASLNMGYERVEACAAGQGLLG